MCILFGQATAQSQCVKLLQAVHKSWMLDVFSEWAWQGFKVSSGPLWALFFIEDGPATTCSLLSLFSLNCQLGRVCSLWRFSLSLWSSYLGSERELCILQGPCVPGERSTVWALHPWAVCWIMLDHPMHPALETKDVREWFPGLQFLPVSLVPFLGLLEHSLGPALSSLTLRQLP